MILNPAYRIVAGPSNQGPLPPTPRWVPRRRALGRRQPSPQELAGLGSFLKKVGQTITKVAVAPIKLVSPKLAANITKIDNKILDAADKLHTNINNWAKKNSKWLIIVAAIAITIYTMGAGATIAAKMMSGMKALGAMVTGGSAAAGGAAAASTAAATTTAATGIGTSVATGVAATATGTTAASIGWGKLAASAASALLGGAKIAALSQQQASSVLQAQNAGYDLGASDPQLLQALQQRAAIPGPGIPTDANGNPLVDEPAGMNYGGAPTNTGIPTKPTGLSSVIDSPYFIPAAIGAGTLLIVALMLRR